MTQAHDLLTSVQRLVTDLSRIDRGHFRPQTNQRENVAEHSLSVATLAWFLHQHVQSKTNLELILKYAIAHDFVEIYAGDVNTFASTEARAQKELTEQKALASLSTEYNEFPSLVHTMNSYQDMADEESHFVWTADKIQQLILGRMDNWRSYYEIKTSKAAFNAKHNELASKAAPELQDLYRAIIEWCNETYDEAA